jgi:HAMP domain-containing protein
MRLCRGGIGSRCRVRIGHLAVLWEECAMTDIVKDLRRLVSSEDPVDYGFLDVTATKAADEIERLRSLVESLCDDNERLIRAKGPGGSVRFVGGSREP